MWTLCSNSTCLQVIKPAAACILDVKVVKYQQYFAPLWRFDYIGHVFSILVIFRIVGRNNSAEDIREQLLV